MMNLRQTMTTWRVPVFLLLLSAVTIFFGLAGAYTIYQNSKTSGTNNGQITVSSCTEKDWAARAYTCTGDYFSTGGGMVSRENVSVTVTGREYQRGDTIDDVYPPLHDSNETASYFVTGKERGSVVYNLPSLFLILLAILMPVIAIALILSLRLKHNTAK